MEVQHMGSEITWLHIAENASESDGSLRQREQYISTSVTHKTPAGRVR
jgi:hypothetical protein